MLKNTLIVTTLLGLVASSNLLSHPHTKFHEGAEHYKNKKMKYRKLPGDRGLHRLQRAFAQLDLTESQKEQLEAIKASNQEAIKNNRETIHSFKKQMKPLLDAETIDENEVRNISLSIAEVKAKQIILHAKMKQQAIALLDQEQKEKLEKMKAKRQLKMQQRRERRSAD